MTQLSDSETSKGLTPPLRMEIRILDLGRDMNRVDVSVYVGVHNTIHRSVVVRNDPCGELPLLVESDLYKWVAWLMREHTERQLPAKKRAERWLNRHPQWLAPSRVAPPVDRP